MRFLFAVAGLTAVYALALASANPWDLGIGAVLSVCVLLAFRPFILPSEGLPFGIALQRAFRFPRLALAASALIVRGTVQVARAVLSRASAQHADFVDMRIGDRTSSGVVINGMLDTLSPGSVLVDIDPDAGTWTLHVLEAEDKANVEAEIEQFYDRFQRPVWP